MMRRIPFVAPTAIITGLLFAGPALAQQSAADLAMKLSNPIAALISVPLQLNYDQDIGPADEGGADGPESGPEGLGVRLVCTLLFPK